VAGAVVDLRVSTLPASHGEKVVIRVLDGRAALRTLDAIGFADGDLRRIRGLLEQREGLLLVTGPTGSGKTTTLYAALREIAARGVNVVTVEDPIEYRLPGIVQVQVHERAGLTFGAALRSIMRQDPDVILVGEIRDRETAEIAIQASLTGHLVLSTLHTNDAASAVTRLIDIGVAGYKIATAVKGVVAQRLVRRVCRDCGAVGCAACGGLGYRGRLAIAEVLVGSAEFERRVAAGAPTEAIAEAARLAGCATLWESGMALVARRETTIEELRRVAAEPARADAGPLLAVPAPPVPEEQRGMALVRAGPVVSEPLRLDQLDAVILALLRWRSGR
jgi:type II secretory ATPase GspE/PulE/Tfp pilus assembly ATPase PilB-like protein